MNEPPRQIRRDNGWEIRNRDGTMRWCAFNEQGEPEGSWKPLGESCTRYHGYSRTEMRGRAREVGGRAVHMLLVRHSKASAAILAEREACAQVAESLQAPFVAARIRERSKP